ncbi:MAG: AsmA-like C-terminal region-containing protein, partial [Pseudomonadota bacterium]|nr:AsmA-like C-terminal region-containing protein [Pseudomonadota bacterium]
TGVSTGEVVLGGGEARIDDSPGIDITGRVPGTVNVSDWWDVWDRMMLLVEKADARALAQGLPTELPENTLGNTNPVSSVELTIDSLDAWDIPIGATRVSGGQEFGEWTIQLANEVARGTVVIREDDNDPLVLLMDFVHVPEPQEPAPEQTIASAAAETSATASQNTDPMSEFIPADVSAMDITIQELYYGTRNFGRWQATTRPIPSGLSLQVLDSDMKGIKLQGTLDWVLREGQHATRMTEFDVSASKVADIQRAFRLQPVVEGDKLTGKFSLDWIGSPAGFDTETLNGKANFRITNGRVNAEGAAALKAFGALNFNSIFRRLRLDFSDLVGSGLAFDTMKGAATIEQGVLTLSEPITVDGPGGKFLTSGMTDLNTTELDMKLAVTFPVTNTLPLVAVLAGFAPPVAASIYVTERLIGDELERFTSASYTISGTWQEPDVKLNKAFDNDVEGKKSRGFMDRVLSIFGLGGDD